MYMHMHLIKGLAGKRSTVAVANLYPVPVVEICTYACMLVFINQHRTEMKMRCGTVDGVNRQTRIDGGAAAHDAGEWDLFIHVVRRATPGALGKLACLGAVAPCASLHASMPGTCVS